LELAFELVCLFIIREGAFYSNKVENLLVSTVVADVSPNQLRISYHAPYLWFTLKQKFPLTFNNLFHLFLLCSMRKGSIRVWISISLSVFFGYTSHLLPPMAWIRGVVRGGIRTIVIIITTVEVWIREVIELRVIIWLGIGFNPKL